VPLVFDPFLTRKPFEVAAITRAFAGADLATMLIFWLRKHGGLADRTVGEALDAGVSLARIVQLVEACVEAP
jgi:hypothetical protein